MAPVIRSVPVRRRRVQLLAFAALLVLVVPELYYSLGHETDSSYYRFIWQDHSRGRPALDLPPEYDESPEAVALQSEYCNERFTPLYLDDFRSHAIQYCAAGSAAALHCFQGQNRPNGEIDSLCIGQGATLDVERRRFVLDCEVRGLSGNETSRGLIPFDQIRPEWYETGPRWIFDHFVKLEHSASGAAAAAVSTRRGRRPTKPQFALLVKRECDNNPWHCLMEIWTMTMTFDVLRTTPDPCRDGAPFFVDRPDLANAQAIVLDDLSDGNLMELWTMFTGRPPIRWKDLLADPEQARAFAEVPRNIIVPLAGAANPLWQNDWVDHDCAHAPTLKAFVHRVLRFYGIPTEDDNSPKRSRFAAADAPSAKTINLTFIDRTGSRKLLDRDALLAAVAAKHPNVQIRSVDFALLTFAEQIRLVHETDILLGVHGAGLTHTMFMRDGVEGAGTGGAVVEIRPETNHYRGFRNLAFMKGLRYFTAHGEQVSKGGGGEHVRRAVRKRDSWHWDDVRIDRDRFMELMDEAVAAVSHPQRESRGKDLV